MAISSTPSPIDDLTFDVISVLRNKARALEAYEKYVSDAAAEGDEDLQDLFQSMRKQDEEDVQVLKEALMRRLDEDLGYDDESDEVEEEDDADLDEEYEDVEEPEIDESAASASSEGPAGESTRRQR